MSVNDVISSLFGRRSGGFVALRVAISSTERDLPRGMPDTYGGDSRFGRPFEYRRSDVSMSRWTVSPPVINPNLHADYWGHRE